MSIITLPSSLVIDKQSWGQQRQDVLFRSMFSSQSVEVSSPLWVTTISSPQQYESTSGNWQAFLMSIRGQTNQVAMGNLARVVPIGTMRGTMTLNSSAAAGATVLSITAGSGQASKTLVAGDFLQLGTSTTQQMVMVIANATSDVNGIISVSIEPPLRNAFSSGAGVIWDHPKALFRRSDSVSSWDYSAHITDSFSLSFVEDVRP